jgi:hypothetical protein
MAICVAFQYDLNGMLYEQVLLPTGEPVNQCSGFVLQTSQELGSDLRLLYQDYFDFDTALSATLITAFLLSFVSGHVLGKILAGLRRV